MGRVDLPYVQVFTDRTGKERCYFRFRGKRWKLPPPDDPAFARAYSSLCREVAGQVAAKGSGEDTLGWLVRQFQASPEFKKRAPSTQGEYRRILSDIGMEHGAKLWTKLTPARVMQFIRDPLAATPRKADTYVSVLSAVFSWAIRRQIARENPCRGVERLAVEGEGYRAWTPSEIQTFCDGCTDDEFLVFALALYLGQRASDIAKLTWFQYDGASFTLRQGKTREPLTLAIHPSLKAVLDAAPRHGGTVLAKPDGTPFARSTISKRIEKARDRMGLSGCTLHGLRTTHSTILANEGASAREIMASTGHRTLAMTEHYTRNADQARMSRQNMTRLPNLSPTPSGKSPK